MEKSEILLDKLVKTLEDANLDCEDNSCHFAKEKKGMRTNGGCRCLQELRPHKLRNVIIEIYSVWRK